MIKNCIKTFFTFFFFLLLFSYETNASDRQFKEINKFRMMEARQGVAVDDNFIYVIGTRTIGKYNKRNGEPVSKWEETEDGPIIHLDSGVIFEEKLYCAHSNYPGIPMTSSIEIWDADSLKHIGSHSFGIQWGSCTWVDHHNGFWWAAFAQYEKWKHVTGKGTEWTTVVKFDNEWRFISAWIYPEEVVKRFSPMSNSGGSWGPDSLLYCTGHDRSEVYVLRIPQSGSVLELVEIIPLSIFGQGIAWDRSVNNIIYGIRKKDKEVIVSEFIGDN